MPPESTTRGPAASSFKERFKRGFFHFQCALLLPILRVLFRLRVKGPRPRPHARGMILAPNHQSWIDAPMVQQAFYPHQITFLMTELYFDLPVANWYFRASNARAIRKGGPSVSALRAARDALIEGRTVCLFPEGEITYDGHIQPGQRGVARLARKTGAVVVPVGIRGAIHVFSRVQKKPRLHTVEVRFGRPMAYSESPDRDGEEAFTTRLMERIRSLAQDP